MRKTPSQARSQRLVEALIDATARVISERGLEHTTTNHIARQAGVSVGSLYQYFADRQDLIEALLVRLSREIAAAVDRALSELMDRDVETVVHGLLATALTAMEGRADVYLELARNWHRLHSLTVVNNLEAHMLDACRRYVLHQRLPIDDLPAALFVVINSTLFTIMRYQSLPRPPISRQALITALSRMIAAYVGPQAMQHRT